jgi:UDP-N-acetylglucosamine--N-acetylmuramyl-(pentapeptide) pyrophosphoryl-undecaprenol N-acetylglucosamine transferase
MGAAPRDRPFAVVAAGGTAGHLQPALLLTRALEAAHGEGSVELFCSRRAIDQRVLEGTGLAIRRLHGSGLPARAGPASVLRLLRAGAAIGLGALEAFGLLARRRPTVLVAFGGFVSVGPVLAAWAQGVPVVLVNVDVVAGRANRVLARVATAVAGASADLGLPDLHDIGVPVDPALFELDRGEEARRRARGALGVPEGRRFIGVMGGSLGARRLNEATLGLARRWRERDDLVLFHIVGERDLSWARAQARAEGLFFGRLAYCQVGFEGRMRLVYQAADVMVCRAGAMTVAELEAAGVPAVLVPLPGAPGAHQWANAARAEARGWAIVLDDARLRPEVLEEALDRLLEAPGRLDAMGGAARRGARLGALERLVEVVERAARSPRRRLREGAAA